VITITEFLHDRIPPSMKAIKEIIKTQEGTIK
jgi:hypothetical protein